MACWAWLEKAACDQPSGQPQSANQLGVRRRKLERRQFLARYPPHLLIELRPRFPVQLAPEEMQLDGALRIGVSRGEDLLADSGVDVELLEKLARETHGQCLAGVALAPGEFPASFEVGAFRPFRHQKPAVPLDDRGGHDDRRHVSGVNGYARQLLAIGQMRHFGFRATQTIAPKSISA